MREAVRVGLDVQHTGQQQWIPGVIVFVATTTAIPPGHGGKLTGLVVAKACNHLALRLNAVQPQPLAVLGVMKLEHPSIRAGYMGESAFSGSREGHDDQAVTQDELEMALRIELQRAAIRHVPGPGDGFRSM